LGEITAAGKKLGKPKSGGGPWQAGLKAGEKKKGKQAWCRGWKGGRGGRDCWAKTKTKKRSMNKKKKEGKE